MDRFTIPMAGRDILGAIKVGENLGIKKDGTLYVQGMEDLKNDMDACLKNVAAGKAAVAAAITEKGVKTAANESFETMAENIRLISGSPGGEKPYIEFEFPVFYSNETITEYGAFIASASSVYMDGQPYKAFDKTYTYNYDCWHPQKGDNQWLQIECPIPIWICDFVIRNRPDYIESPIDVMFMGSNDGENWNTIKRFGFNEFEEANQEKVITIVDNTVYKYFRWHCIKPNQRSQYSVIAHLLINAKKFKE